VRLYEVELTPAAARQLRKLDHPVQRRIYHRLRRLGTELRPKSVARFKGMARTLYCIREGSYRIVYAIEDDRLLILVIRIAHRREAYR